MSRLRESLRKWANKPSKREIKEIEIKKLNQNIQASEESASVRMLKKHNSMLEELLRKAYETISSQAEVIQNHKSGDWQDKLIDKGLDMLPFLFNKQTPPIDTTPKKIPSKPQETQVPLNAGTKSIDISEETTKPAFKGLSSEEIKAYVGQIEHKLIPKLASLPYEKFSALIKSKIPDATQENIFEGYELIQAKKEANNG